MGATLGKDTTGGRHFAMAAKRLGWEDYLAFPEDGVRREILDGEAVPMPSPSVVHQELVLELGMRLRRYCQAEGLGRVLVAPLAVRLAEHQVVEPDVLFVAAYRPEDYPAVTFEPHGVAGPPDLVAEVLAPSNRTTDLATKRLVYEAAGVREYWIVDPEAQSVTRLVLDDGRYRADGPVFSEPGGVIATPLVPGFTLDVGDLFEVLGEA